jgi:hypothetical protein
LVRRGGGRRFVMLAGLSTKAAEHDAPDRGKVGKRLTHGAKRDRRGPAGWKTEDAGRDGRKGDGCETLLGGKRQAVAVAGSKLPVLAALPAAPNRSNRVDHVTRGQAEARGDLRLTSGATAKFGACLGKIGACGTVDRAADAAAGSQHLIGGIDDGIDVQPGDVAFDDLDAFRHRTGVRRQASGVNGRYCGGGGDPAEAEEEEAEDGFTERIQAMIFHRSSSLFTTPPMAGIGPTTFSEPLRL